MSLIICAIIGLIISLAYLICAARMNDDNTGSETGIEEEK